MATIDQVGYRGIFTNPEQTREPVTWRGIAQQQPTAAGGDTNISGGVDALTLTELAASLNAATSFTAGVDALTLTEFPATINAETAFTTTTDALTLTAYPATITTGADTNISATTDALSLTEFAAGINAETAFTATTDALTLTTYPATVSLGVAITATTDALTLSEFAATLTFDTSFTTTTDALTLTEYPATVTTGEVVVAAETKGGGKKRRHQGRKYPRWVMINGERYRVKSPDEERQLLQAMLERATAAQQMAETPREVVQAQKRRIRIERRIEAVDDSEALWLARLQDEDEEIIVMLQ